MATIICPHCHVRVDTSSVENPREIICPGCEMLLLSPIHAFEKSHPPKSSHRANKSRLGLIVGITVVVFVALNVVAWTYLSDDDSDKSPFANEFSTKLRHSENWSQSQNNKVDIKERWPAVFTFLDRQSSPKEVLPVLTEEMIGGMMTGYGFYRGQRYINKRLYQRFPSLRDRLILARTKFNARFKPSANRIEQFMSENWPDNPNFEAELRKTLEEQLVWSQITLSEAEESVTGLERVSEGDIPLQFLKPLLMFHPTYMAQPAREFLDGYVEEYRTDGTGKSRGVLLGIEYPTSWKAKEGRRPHVVKKFISQNGSGFASAVITIVEIPAPFSGMVSENDISTLAGEGLWEHISPGLKLIDEGLVRIAGRPSLWGEVSGDLVRVGVTFQMHSLVFAFIHKDCLIFVSLSTMSKPGLSEENAKDMFWRNGPLFQLIVNSIDVFNRYEVFTE